MILYPAIDLYQGKVVRLKQGDFNIKTEYDITPLEAAHKFAEAGCTWVHIIDLEGAQVGHPAHTYILQSLHHLGLMVQYGGGLRSLYDIEETFKAGATRLYVGSLLVENEKMASQLFSTWGNGIIPAVDIKEGKVATRGWTSTSFLPPSEYISFLKSAGYTTLLVTAVQRDGTGVGPDMMLYSQLLKEFPDISIIAAGGISSLKDLEALRSINIAGAVLGRVLYEKDFDLKEALRRVSLC